MEKGIKTIKIISVYLLSGIITSCQIFNEQSKSKVLTVTFYQSKVDAHLNSKTPLRRERVTKNEKVIKPQNVKHPNENLFVTEWKNVDNDKEWDFNTPITQELNLYASKWEKFFTVSFFQTEKKANKNKELASHPKKFVTEGNKLTIPTNPSPPQNREIADSPEHPDYRAYFEGWHYKDGSVEKKWNFSNTVTQNLTLYGKWNETKYQVKSEYARPVNYKYCYFDFYREGTLYALLFNESDGRECTVNGSRKTEIKPKEIDTSLVTDMSSLFSERTNFNEEIGGWNTENVESMANMFLRAETFDQPIGGWNTENVENMDAIFSGAKAFNQPIGNWNTKNVKNMEFLFAEATSFNQFIGNWKVGKVLQMRKMFFEATAFTQDMSSWNWKPSCKVSKAFDLNINNINTADNIFTNSGIDGQEAKYPPFYTDLKKGNNADTLENLGSKNCTPEID